MAKEPQLASRKRPRAATPPSQATAPVLLVPLSPSRDVTLGAILLEMGWRTRFLKAHLTSDKAAEDFEDDWLEFFVFGWFEDARSKSRSTFAKALYGMGLTKKRASDVWRMLAPLSSDSSYTERQLLQMAMQVMRGKVLHHPEVAVGAWKYGAEVSTEWESSIVRGMRKPLQTWNARLDALPDWINNDQDGEFVFHAASWASAESIAKHGILLQKGRQCLDFGQWGSFYLSPGAKQCVNFAVQKSGLWQGEAAMCVFRWKTSSPYRKFQFHRFTGTDETWNAYVRHSRQCMTEDEDPRSATVKNLEKNDGIFGPMVKNPEAVANGAVPQTHVPPRHQWAIKSARAAKWLDAQLVGVVFLQKLG